MPEKTSFKEIELKKIEKGDNLGYKLFFYVKNFGEYGIEVGEDKYLLFRPGKLYEGQFKVSGSPDFLGQEDKWENVCTLSEDLEKIVLNDEVLWEKEK